MTREQFKQKTITHYHNKQLYAATEKNELQETINKLKHQQIANEQLIKTETAYQTTPLSQAIPKNVNMASVTNRGQQIIKLQ